MFCMLVATGSSALEDGAQTAESIMSSAWLPHFLWCLLKFDLILSSSPDEYLHEQLDKHTKSKKDPKTLEYLGIFAALHAVRIHTPPSRLDVLTTCFQDVILTPETCAPLWKEFQQVRCLGYLEVRAGGRVQ